MLPKQCPKCGGLCEPDGKSCSCGWKVGGRKESATDNDRQCAGYEGSERCQTEGWLSHSVRGGPWYCGKHWHVTVGSSDARASNAGHMQAIRELIKRKTSLERHREPGEDG